MYNGSMMSNDPENYPQHQNRLPVIYLWLPIIGVLFLLGWLIERKEPSDQYEPAFYGDETYPSEVSSYGEQAVEIHADRQGHYVFIGYINGKKVRFLLDTGATVVAIPEHLAEYLGMDYGESHRVSTANGIARAYRSQADSVQVGSIEVRDVEAALLTGMVGDEILLGMSFLRHLQMTQENGTIRLSKSY